MAASERAGAAVNAPVRALEEKTSNLSPMADRQRWFVREIRLSGGK
jgi:hypothetical protein